MQTYNIYLFGEITYELVASVMEKIDEANTNDDYTDILITLCSYGGYNLPAFALYEKIAASEKKVTIKATGTCQSSAVVVLQAGHKRVATEKTVFMLHQIDSPVQNPNYSELIREAEHMKNINKLFVELTLSRSKMSKEQMDEHTRNSFYLTAQEALDLGFIDEIVK